MSERRLVAVSTCAGVLAGVGLSWLWRRLARRRQLIAAATATKTPGPFDMASKLSLVARAKRAAPLRELMQRCWDQKADARPSAEQVVDLLQEMRSRHSLEYQWNMPAAHWGSLSRSPSMSPSMQRVYQGELHVRGGVAKAVLRVQG